MTPSTPSRRQFLTGLGGAGAATLAGCVGFDESPYAPGENADSEWPMPDYDRGSTGYAPDAAGPRESATERWSVETIRPTGRPVVADGTVFLAHVGGLLALAAGSGEERWRFGGRERPWTTAPVVTDGLAVVGMDDQPGPALRAFDTSDGTEVWTLDTRGDVRTPPTVDHDARHLYVGDDTGRVYELDPGTGEVQSTFDVFGEVSALAHHRSLLVGTSGGEVYDLYSDADGLRGLWRRKLPGKVTDLAVADAVLTVATFGGPLYRLQDGAHAGSTRWSVEAGAQHVASTPYDVVGTDGGGLSVHHYRTGDTRWSRDASFPCAPAVAGDTVYAGGGELGSKGHGYVAAYAVRKGGLDVPGGGPGTRRWKYDLDSAPLEGVSVADGAVFVATQGKRDVPSRLVSLEAE